ncbi:MAG: hypothetical protein UV73_C0017G0010 [Candidatus Gottesmanbacteria bacterium GW2011_GWA2_43_14]|uniref:Sulfatase N-terminal domain-containing protein n=1 Tax=Candidatus Gottesmanbacteria bacterium GW2011_GWA2_43_14 TaxID=1618443 RepID=A0A0G1FK70_9BACT|nr:MAG: hypothetical protein UV73_C0017G0010 [Candidatus Gottesmanbacteria bacterium GW2011_GWA2_43_14]
MLQSWLPDSMSQIMKGILLDYHFSYNNEMPFHPFLFAVYPVLYLVAHNIRTLRLADIWLPLGVVVIFTGLLFSGINLFIKNRSKASLIASLLLVVFLNYGFVFDYLRSTSINNFIQGKQAPGYIAALLITGFSSYLILKSKSGLTTLVTVSNRLSLVLVLIPIMQIAGFYYFHPQTVQQDFSLDYKNESSESQVVNRDIYYFIFDRYGREDVLKEAYDFDNSEFITYLTEKGFVIPARSWANYTQTQLSLASSLNMQYLDPIVEKQEEQSTDVRPLISLIEDNEVIRFLKKRGYTYIHAGSWWAITAYNRHADRNINLSSLSELSEVFFSRTIFHPLFVKFNIPVFNNRLTKWKRPLFKFEELSKIPGMGEPTFTFAHFLMTHEPYVFDAEGKFLSQEEIDSREASENYRAQLIFANKKIRELIDLLISASGENRPIIIIQGDEGPYPESYRTDAENFDWTKAGEDDIRHKMAIMNALYLPGIDDSEISDFITPVNTFRLVLNKYFGQELPLLPNVSFLSNVNRPFKFLDMPRDPAK